MDGLRCRAGRCATLSWFPFIARDRSAETAICGLFGILFASSCMSLCDADSNAPRYIRSVLVTADTAIIPVPAPSPENTEPISPLISHGAEITSVIGPRPPSPYLGYCPTADDDWGPIPCLVSKRACLVPALRQAPSPGIGSSVVKVCRDSPDGTLSG